MGKTWNVRVDDREYKLELKRGSMIINDEKTPLKNSLSKRNWVQNEYEITVGSKKALLVISNLIGGPKLVIDGKDCATGEDYVPVKFPAWSYIFVVLHLLNFLNGALGVLIAIFGVSITAAVSTNSKFNIIVKIVLNLVVLLLAYILIFGIALAVYA